MVARIVESPAELPLPLPPGLTVVPAQDPDRFARALAARTGGVLVGSADEAMVAIARRRAGDDPELALDATEVAWLRSVLEGGAVQVPPRLVLHAERGPYLQDMARRLGDARAYLKHMRVALLKREAAVQAEARRAPGSVALAEVEPELARRVAHRVAVTLRRARAAKRALGPKPTLDRETEQVARRAMSRLEDASFAYAKARAAVHARLAVGNVVGLLLALLAAIMLWSGADLDAASLYAVFALAGLSPLVALAIGGVGAVHARRRVAAAQAECGAALRRAGVADTGELSRRRGELEEWLARADATAAARDAWQEALQAWQAMAGPEADPRDVEELLGAGDRVRAAKAEAAEARWRAEAALKAVADIEAEAETRLEQVLGGRPLSAVLGEGGRDDRPIVLLGSGRDRVRIEQMQPPVPVALITAIGGEAVLDLRPDGTSEEAGEPVRMVPVVSVAAETPVAPAAPVPEAPAGRVPRPPASVGRAPAGSVPVAPVPAEPVLVADPRPTQAVPMAALLEDDEPGDTDEGASQEPDTGGGQLLVLDPEAARRIRRRARRLR